MSGQRHDDRLSLEYLTPDDEQLVISTLNYVKSHQGQIPKADSEHLDQVLRVLTEWRMPARPILALLAHHLLEHGISLSRQQAGFFGDETLQMTQDFRDLDKPPVKNNAPDHLKRAFRNDRLRNLFIIAYTNLELTLLCLAAHVVRMRSIKLLDYRDARLLAENNEAIFLSLLEMLGMWQLRRELGDLSLATLNPSKIWDEIQQRQELAKSAQEKHFKRICATLLHELLKAGIESDIRPHLSPASSIYRRMLRGEALVELVRQVKIDVVVATEEECYQTLRLIHQQWPPMVGRTHAGGYLRDLIASPKFNGYRTLATTVGYRGPDSTKTEIPIEFRVRTQDIERTNAYGVIAARYLSVTPVKIKNAWWENEEALDLVRTPSVGSTEEIFVFSPTGEVGTFPRGSTPIDYAYRVHSEVGDHCKRIWVNGQPASYAQKLQNGDLIEIEVDPRYPGPDESWLNIAQTSTAKRHIKRALQQRRTVADKGRDIIDALLKRELGAYGLPDFPEEKVDKFLKDTAEYFSYPDLAALYFDVAYPQQSLGSPKPSPNRIVARLIAAQLADHIVKANWQPIGISKDRIRFAQCYHNKKPCRVTPGSEIVGRIVRQGTRFEGLIVYRQDCPNAPEGETAIPLAWLGNRRAGEPVRVSIQAVDQPRLLDHVLHAVYDLYGNGLYLLGVRAEVSSDRSAWINMTIHTPSYQLVEELSKKLNQLREGGKIDDLHIDALSPFEKMLFTESKILPNPYTTGPARDRRIFKGRDVEINRIVTSLGGNQNFVVLYGTNRVGKTSLLCYLDGHIANEYNYVPVLIDMAGLAEYSEAQFWLETATAIDEAVSRLFEGKRSWSEFSWGGTKRDTFGEFREWLGEAKIAVGGRRILIMIDELSVVDERWDRDEALNVVYRLKSLVESQYDVAFVFCVQETLYKKAASSQTGVASWPLLRAGLPVRLDHLDRRAAEKVIREPMGQMVQYDDRVVERMLDLTACHPYYLQHMLYQIVEHVRMNRPKSATLKVTPEDLNAVIPHLLDKGGTLFHDFLREYLELKGVVLSALGYVSATDFHGGTMDELQAALEKREFNVRQSALAEVLEELRDAGVVERHKESDQTKYHIRVPLFAHWLRENRPLDLLISQ